MAWSQVPRVLRTVKHLRWTQVAVRLQRMAARQWPHRLPQLERPVTTADCPDVPVFHHPCARGEELLLSLEQGQLCLLNETRPFGVGHWDWQVGEPHQDRLWTITLHYHQWLFELARLAVDSPWRERARRLLDEGLGNWLDQCGSPQEGSLAWNSYAIATRMSWSIRAWRLLRAGNALGANEAWLSRWERSLYAQAEHLSSHVEWDLRANHLLRDAVGLAWAGRFFTGPRATRWLAMAERIATVQVEEQLLDDGGHFERSPFYHLEVMDDWLALAQLLPHPALQATLRDTWRRAATFASWLRHPDGRTVQFNDGSAATADNHLRHGEQLQLQPPAPPRGGRHFADSGIVAWHGTPWTVFFDVGPIGPDYQPGHGHADTLTVEASCGGRRLFVDPGCLRYDDDADRRYDRSTASHNTVCIDGSDSSEVWHIFRVGRRARPLDVEADIAHDRLAAAASHNGYDHLGGRPRHRRHLRVTDNGPLVVRDEISGTGRRHVQGGWLVDPGWTVTAETDGWMLANGSHQVRVTVTSDVPLQLSAVEAHYRPQYGRDIPTQRIQWEHEGELPLTVDCVVQAMPSD